MCGKARSAEGNSVARQAHNLKFVVIQDSIDLSDISLTDKLF